MSPFPDCPDELEVQGLLSAESKARIREQQPLAPFSLFFELNAILYVGVLTLSIGLGMFVYNNLSRIGHVSLIAVIGLISAGCFYVCYRKAPAFSKSQVAGSGALYDYLLLLACLLQVTFFGYLQYQFHPFGTEGLEFLCPAISCFAAAYYFDHLGALSVGITSLGAFFGITVSPLNARMYENFNSTTTVCVGLLLSVLLIAGGITGERRGVKSHFSGTYYQFALNVGYFAVIGGLFVCPAWGLFIPVLGLLSGCAHWHALRNKLFYFFLINLLYSYFAVCVIYCRLIDWIQFWGEGTIYLSFLLLLGSSVGMIAIIRSFRKKISA
jgi:hypothetical protein